MPARRGFSLVQILVVLVMVGTLVLLGIYFFNQQREHADRLKCALHLKFLGDAVVEVSKSGFRGNDQTGYLPPSRLAEGYAAWPVLLGAYLPRAEGLGEWDLERPFLEQPENVRQAWTPEFFCPSRKRSTFTLAGAEGGSLGDYAAAAGDGSPEHPWDSPRANGAFVPAEAEPSLEKRLVRWKARIRFEDLVRGLSHTILIGEKHIPLGDLNHPDAGDGPFFDGRALVYSTRVGGVGFPLGTPGSPILNNFGSWHPGLCNFLYADTSVRPFTTDGSPAVLGAAIRRE